MLVANLSMVYSRVLFILWMRVLVVAEREEVVVGTRDWSVWRAAVWEGSERRVASIEKGKGSMEESGRSMGATSEGERSRLSHIRRSSCSLQ